MMNNKKKHTISFDFLTYSPVRNRAVHATRNYFTSKQLGCFLFNESAYKRPGSINK